MAVTPTERILGLAAYAHERSERHVALTLDAIVADVPGYETPSGTLTAGSREWETVRKQLQRDLADLREHWGIELEFDATSGEYHLAPPCFTPAQRRALLAAAAAVAVEGVESDVPGALGTAVDDTEAQIVIRVHELVTVLRDAIGAAQPVAFDYDGAERVVEPYALGTWHNRWYVAGRDRDRDGLRRFRLDRIDATTPSPIRAVGAGSAYEVPSDFDADAAFDLDPNSWGTDPCLRARVEVAPDHLDAFLAEFSGATVVLASPTRDIYALATPKLEIALDVREYGSFRNRLLAFGANAVVTAPPELVALVRDHLRTLAEAR